MKILINRKPVEGPWGGGNLFVKALHKYLSTVGHEIVHQFSDNIDVIFIQDPRYSDLGISINEIVEYKQYRPSVKIIHRVNECDARKGTAEMDQLLRASSQYTDHTIFVSEWMRKYHLSRGWNCHDTSVIYNGVDKQHFFKSDQKINNEKVNIVTHHWANNRMKGFDIYEALDKFVGRNHDFTFTYVGRELGTFRNTQIISPLYEEKLGKELSKYDVYISGSLFDPGPNHILESLACELPTYVINNGGGAVEFAGEDHSFSSAEELISILTAKKFSKNTTMLPGLWKECAENYVSLVDSL